MRIPVNSCIGAAPSWIYMEESSAKEKVEETIKNTQKRLKHEKKKLECIKKLEALGIDLEILKEVLR